MILAIYLLAERGPWEWLRAILAGAVTAVTLFLAGRVLGAEPEKHVHRPPLRLSSGSRVVDIWLEGRVEGLFAAVTGVLALDIGQYFWLTRVGGRERFISVGPVPLMPWY